MQPFQTIVTGLILVAVVATLMRAILRPNREPASRLAWVIVILVVPIIGLIAYLLLGEARISYYRRERA
jgi:cardiolipin synthase